MIAHHQIAQAKLHQSKFSVVAIYNMYMKLMSPIYKLLPLKV